MARITPIRLSANDRTEYARLVRNTRAKISRTKKKYDVDLTNEVTLPALDEFKTRKQFNEWKEKQSSFTNPHNLTFQFRKNEHNVVASKKEINKIERDNKIAINRAKREVAKHKDKPFVQGGTQYGTVGERTQHLGEAPVLGIHIPKKFDFNTIRNQDRLKSVKSNMEKRTSPDYYDQRLEQLKLNFIEAVSGSFNSEADELIEMIKEIPAHDFYDLYIRFDEFDFEIWDSEGQFVGANAGHIDKLMGYIEKYNNNDLNNDLKGF